jgi:hypothetical protein
MKLKIKLFVDIILLISFIVASVSAFMGRPARELHEISGKIMIVFALIHTIMNWRILATMIKNSFKKPKEAEN